MVYNIWYMMVISWVYLKVSVYIMIQYNVIHWYRVLLKTLVNGQEFDTSIEPTKIKIQHDTTNKSRY
jgi:hypothetical protein